MEEILNNSLNDEEVAKLLEEASIKTKQYFTWREALDKKYCIIVPKDYDTFPKTNNKGSYNVAPARVLGLTYPEYLVMVQTIFEDNVKIVGKNKEYPIVYWERGRILSAFVDLLNKRMTLMNMYISEESREKSDE